MPCARSFGEAAATIGAMLRRVLMVAEQVVVAVPLPRRSCGTSGKFDRARPAKTELISSRGVTV